MQRRRRSRGRFEDSHTNNSSGTIPTFTAAFKNLSPYKKQTMPCHQSCLILPDYETDWVIIVSVQQGSADPAGLQEGLTWWMQLLSQLRITKKHKLSFKLLCWHSLRFSCFFFVLVNKPTCTPSNSHSKKLLMNNKKLQR